MSSDCIQSIDRYGSNRRSDIVEKWKELITFPGGTDLCDEGVGEDAGGVEGSMMHITERTQFVENFSLEKGSKPTLRDYL